MMKRDESIYLQEFQRIGITFLIQKLYSHRIGCKHFDNSSHLPSHQTVLRHIAQQCDNGKKLDLTRIAYSFHSFLHVSAPSYITTHESRLDLSWPYNPGTPNHSPRLRPYISKSIMYCHPCCV
jgi:hypothetical protein